MSSSNCCVLICIQISQEAGEVVWYSRLLKNFPQFVVIHTKALAQSIKQKQMFFWSSLSFAMNVFILYLNLDWKWEIINWSNTTVILVKLSQLSKGHGHILKVLELLFQERKRERLCFSDGLSGKESACNSGDPGSNPGLGRSPGGEHGNLLQYSCLESPMDRRAWWATFHRITKSQLQLSY